MLRTSLCDYSDGYMLVKETVTGGNTAAANAEADNTDKKVIFKNFASFTSCISRINKTKSHDAQNNDVVMAMLNLKEYNDIYSKTLLK